MNDKALLRAWKWVEAPYLVIFSIVIAGLIVITSVPFSGWMPFQAGWVSGWITSTCSVCAFITWYIVRQKFYKKHERLIVTLELEALEQCVKQREHFLATGKWPDPEQVKQIASDAKALALANADEADIVKPKKETTGE